MRINKRYLLCIIMLLPFFAPTYLASVPFISCIYSILYIVATVWAVFSYVSRKIAPSLIVKLFILLEGWFFIITYFNGGSIGIAYKRLWLIPLLASIVDIFSKQMKILLKSLMLHFELCIYINFLTVIFYPNGFFSRANTAYDATMEWFLGANNNFVIWLFPAMCVVWLCKEYFGNDRRCYLLFGVIILTELVNGSSTGLVGVILLFLCINFKTVKKIITPIRSVVLAVILFVVIVINRSYYFLEPIIVGILGKDMTFTYRIYIWDNAIKAIGEKPLVGYGLLNNEDVVSMLGNAGNMILRGAVHCHCQILQIIFQGGIIGLLILILIYIISLKKCILNWDSKMAQICAYTVFVYTIMCITEVFEYYPLMYLVLILPFYLDKMRSSAATKNYYLKRNDGNCMTL